MNEWYYRLGEDVQGPVSEEDLNHIFESGALPDETRVWCEGMQDWKAASKILMRPRFCATSREDQSPSSHSLPSQPDKNLKSSLMAWMFAAAGVLCIILIAAFGWSALVHHHKQTVDSMGTGASVLNIPSDQSRFQFTAKDRIDLKNGDVPATIISDAKAVGINVSDMTIYLRGVWRQVAAQGDKLGFLQDDSALFWETVHSAIMDAAGERSNTDDKRDVFEIFKGFIIGKFESAGALPESPPMSAPSVLGGKADVSTEDLNLVELRGLTEDQSVATILLIHKYGFSVADILKDWDDMHAQNVGSTKWEDRNLNLANQFLLNAFLSGKFARGKAK